MDRMRQRISREWTRMDANRKAVVARIPQGNTRTCFQSEPCHLRRFASIGGAPFS